MFEQLSDRLRDLSNDRDEEEIRTLLNALRGDVEIVDSGVEADLLICATMALYHGRRIKLASADAFDALAAICLVLGEQRVEFFENAFLKRMMHNPKLSPREKLNRIVEVVIGTIPRPQPAISNDNPMRESA